MNIINTVNVIELHGGVINSLYSFPATPEGIIDAENLFKKLATESGMIPEEMENCLNGGIFSYDDYDIIITHSV